ncbi:ribosomal protein S6--L-glutamate ligase [Streptomyces olivoverticillatus]|uniref:Ribosomal protein S6--L-glutamate ligase n=1 Tax=Streptomyces olivoverticillatus TaxID=66427 RepID=A0A7W7LNZ8_9ACTN|nr:alpha-L-glutamate ligase [Streptomyces olivoverticillatus]MBB4893755.1 ribosomal protein S6--L-glutamate ligase [Streptomyces olivoverticillatus]
MRICLLTPDAGHPLLARTAALLRSQHEVSSLDPNETTGLPDPSSLADVYLLKTRTPRALAYARHLEEHGAPVLNSAAATELCQDRTAMAARALAAGLPFAATRTEPSLTHLAVAAGAGDAEGAVFPVVVKSRHSRRHDLVARVGDRAQLRALARQWPDEPVVVQDFTPNDGWDHKLWVVDGHVFAGLRRSELATPVPDKATRPLDSGDLPVGLLDLVRRVGEVFALDVYGVDVLDAGGTPVIVDINAFPGIRGQIGAPEALADLALRTAAGGRRPRVPATM